ncbi:MAG: inverse autotransporter beta domain-containing protein [Cyanobacteria bacterium P01_A01_bin.114]
MKHPIWYTSASLLVALMFAAPEAAQSETVEAEAVISQEPTAADLGTDFAIRPRFGLDFDTAGSGAESFGQFESFIPLWQNAGRELLFFQGQLLLDTDANLGTNLQLGYRHYLPSSDRIFGGYIAFDKRGTDSASFDQLGIGLETLGENWDLRLNGFLPIGDRRELVDSNTVDAGTQLTNLQFIGNQLIADSQQQQAEINRFESALGGFDLELGTKLLDIGEAGALRGFAGLYYYDGEGVDGSLGWRLRLQAEPTDYLRTGLSVQNDDIFGTTVRFNIGAAFPGYRATSSGTDSNTVLARLGESIGRTGHIVVDEQTEVGDVVATEADIQTGPVLNPATGDPWFFNHVTPDGAAGDGTFEAPYDTVTDATNTIPTDGNGIIYIADSNGAVISEALTIPGGVQLLSTGPAQFIDAFDESVQIQLPFSDSGDFPIIQGNVEMNSSPSGPTVLSGFSVQNDDGVGITADNSLGEIVISDNRVTASGASIEASTVESTTAGGVTVSNNLLSTGIDVDANNSTVTGDIIISGNQIGEASETEAESSGIGVNLDGATLTGNITVTDNEIKYSGIIVSSQNSSLTGDITLSENAIENGYSYGIGIGNTQTTIDGNIVISGNVIEAEGFGILMANYSYNDISGELIISDNVIGGEAVEAVPYGGVVVLNFEDSAIGEGVTVSGNTVEAQAIGVGVVNYSYSEIAGGVTITGNPDIQVSSDGDAGFFFFENGAAGIAVANANGGTLTDGVNISENGSIQVATDETAPALGIVVLNTDGQIEGSVEINNNLSIDVTGANTDINPTNPSDFGTAGIVVANYSDDNPSTISGDITISGNPDISSSEYGIVIVNSSDYSYGGDGIGGDITVASNGVVAVDDGVLVVNLDEIEGSVILSGSTITSGQDDGVDFSNLTPFSDIDGDVTLTGNTIDADGDEVKCTNNGTIAGSVSSPSACQNTPMLP